MSAVLPERRFKRGFRALVGELGMAEALRFIVALERGHGDSVKELKAAWRGKDVRQIYQTLVRARAEGRLSKPSAAS